MIAATQKTLVGSGAPRKVPSITISLKAPMIELVLTCADASSKEEYKKEGGGREGGMRINAYESAA